MTLKRSELKEMIREVIREELQRRSLHEAPDDAQRKAQEEQRFNNWLRRRKMIDEDGLMSSLGREIEDCLGNCQVPGPDGKSQNTYTGSNLRCERTTLNNGLVSVYLYTLAHDIPEDFIKKGDAGIYGDLVKGYKELKNYKTSHPDCLTLDHKIYCEADKQGNSYNLVYKLVITPDWNKCVFWSNSYPDARRGQTQADVRG